MIIITRVIIFLSYMTIMTLMLCLGRRKGIVGMIALTFLIFAIAYACANE